MKKFLAIILAVVMLCVICGCSSAPQYVNPVAEDPNFVVWNDGDFTICFPKTMTILSEDSGIEEGTILSVSVPSESEGNVDSNFEVQRIDASLLDFSSAKDIDDATVQNICDDAVSEIVAEGGTDGMEISSDVGGVEYVICGATEAARTSYSILINYPEYEVSISTNIIQYYIFDRGAAYVVSFVSYDQDCSEVFKDVTPYIFVD